MIGQLLLRNVTINGRRTSMRQEASMWEALRDIAARERTTVDGVCSEVHKRLSAQSENNGHTVGNLAFASAVRVFVMAYYRRAATVEGHALAGHGGGNIFAGTPFDGDPSLSPSGMDVARHSSPE